MYMAIYVGCNVGEKGLSEKMENPHSGLGNSSKRKKVLDYGIYVDRFLAGCSPAP